MRSRWAVLFTATDNAKIAVAMGRDASSDFGTAMDCIEYLHPDKDPASIFEEAWLQTEEILHKQWSNVVRFANVLQKAQDLRGDELQAAIHPIA